MLFTSISGRSVLVTGGTRGIGKGIAAAFAAQGVRVVITGRDQAAGDQAAADLTAAVLASGQPAGPTAQASGQPGGPSAQAGGPSAQAGEPSAQASGQPGGPGGQAGAPTAQASGQPGGPTAQASLQPGSPVTFIAADVSDPASCAAMTAAALELHGGLDVVCCNAGVFPAARLEDMTPGQLDEVLGINLKGTFFTVQAALPALKRAGRGRVIVTSSITGPVTGYTGWSHYGASKAGQLGFVRSAALELARSGITVNAILPGNIVTEGLDSLGAGYLASMEAAIPLGHLGSVADIASAALFFASDEAGFVTGQTLIVDGGQTIPESPEAMG